MEIIISIEYCTSWGYVAKAVGLAEELLREYKNNLTKVELIPSSGGVYEISLNGNSIFSKKELDRYPEDGEIKKILESNL